MPSRKTTTAVPRRGRNLALELVESIGDRIRDGRLARGEKLPTEAEIMAGYGVSPVLAPANPNASASSR